MCSNNISPELVDEFAAGKYLGISVSTLRRDRVLLKRTIPVIYIGACVRYSIHALNKWIESSMDDEQSRQNIQAKTTPIFSSTIKLQRGRPRKTDCV